MENNQNKIKCDICNTFYSKIYMSRHLQSLKHIENKYEYAVEEDIETQLVGNCESDDEN
jgi:hypothetical protein